MSLTRTYRCDRCGAEDVAEIELPLDDGLPKSWGRVMMESANYQPTVCMELCTNCFLGLYSYIRREGHRIDP